MIPFPAKIFSIRNHEDFNAVSLEIFRYQAKKCEVYQKYIGHLAIEVTSVLNYREIPFLPVSFFKSHQVIAKGKTPEITFYSSGTTGQTSKHLVSQVSIYKTSYRKTFEMFYGKAENICILALLPSYLEQKGSSLIYMIDDLLQQSKNPKSGHFLDDSKNLYSILKELKRQNQQTILFGVSYALLDFVENYQIKFPELIVMETGGMKGKRKEMIREELHQTLCAGFGVDVIHSEYGMTELLSQAYSHGRGVFSCPPWMKILLRDTSDPLSLINGKQTGGINVIDLANINSCSFIATQDLGRLHQNGKFEVMGRFDNSDLRGCNLLVQ